MDNTLFIVNPAAFGGAGVSGWERFCAALGAVPDSRHLQITARPGHAVELAKAADGYEVVAAVGGDGTVREIVTGLQERSAPRPRLLIVPAGTGNDIAREIGIRSVADAITALRQPCTRRIDLIQVDCHDSGAPVRRYACLTASAGVSATVIHCLKPWMKRRLGSDRAYLLATLLALLRYKASLMRIRWDDGATEGRFLMLNVGNGEWESGGSMRMSPGARMDDGELNAMLIAAAPLPRILRKLPGVFTGEHIHEPEVSYFPMTRITVESAPPVGIQMDGDVRGETPATFTVLPSALEVLTPDMP